jgi:hypothetical protein
MEYRSARRFPGGAAGAGFAAALAMTACGGKNKGAEEPQDGDQLAVPKIDPKLCADAGGNRVQTFDLNHDDKPDVWKIYARVEEGGTAVEVLTCKQIDYDHDGTKDYVATYRQSGELIAESFDFTFDGKFDAQEHYDRKTGKVYLVERDSDHDKQPDTWENYDVNGALESIKIDRNADGKPDVWEQYKAGELVEILYDDDFDSRVDRRESVTPPAPPPAAPAAAPTEPAAPAADASPGAG